MDLDDLEEEVRDFASEIDSLCEDDYELDDLYKGVQIYFSPIHYGADIMFLGINPGAGYYNYWNEKVEKFYELDEHEYITYSDDDGYTLAQEWYSIFDNIGRLDLLEDSFKTNCYYFATEDTSDLNQLKRLLRDNSMWVDDKAQEWTETMLEEINPRLLILEGMKVKNLIQNWYGDDYEEYNRYRGYINSLSIEVIVVERIYSNIKNKDKVENNLERMINNLEL